MRTTGVGSLNSWLRNGISRVKLNTSSTAARRLQTIVPAMRHQCGRRKVSRRRYTGTSVERRAQNGA